jgi:predicted nucleic acid-binding Zn ribbon protein
VTASRDEEENTQGPDAVRSALNRARAAASSRGRGTGAGNQRGPRSGRSRGGGIHVSGAGPDSRDPQLVGAGINRLVRELGWGTEVAVGSVIGRWETVVGPEMSRHCRPEAFEDGVLVVRADSTAWATQVRLLAPSLLRRLAEEVGSGTVTRVVVRGPSGPDWRRGPRVAPGSRGPRDTYG